MTHCKIEHSALSEVSSPKETKVETIEARFCLAAQNSGVSLSQSVASMLAPFAIKSCPEHYRYVIRQQEPYITIENASVKVQCHSYCG